MQAMVRHVTKFTLLILAVAASVNLGSLTPRLEGKLFGFVPNSVLLQLLLLSLAITLVLPYSQIVHGRNIQKVTQGSTFSLVPLARAKQLQDQARGHRFASAVQAQLFALALLEPAEMRQRVVEKYDPDRRSVRQRVSIDFRIPERLVKGSTLKNMDYIYFPILIPRKGKFQDDFLLRGADGSSIPVLVYREYLQLAAQVLRSLLRTAFSMVPANPTLPTHVLRAEFAALAVIMQRCNRRGRIPDLTGKGGWLQITKLDAADQRSLEARNLAASFAEKLTTHYAIVGMVPVNGQRRHVLHYEQTLIPDLKLSRFQNWFGLRLGARPVDLTISLAGASTCQSYHLHIAGSDGTYLGRQERLDCEATLVSRSRSGPTPPHIRFRQRLGQPYGHVYTRFFPEPVLKVPGARRTFNYGEREQPRVRFQFFEIPPSSVMRAAVSAVASFLLILLIGIVISRNPDPGTDAPAILLSLPAIAAAWLGFDNPNRRLLEGTLTARFSLISTAILSIAASGLFMTHKALTPKDNDPINAIRYNWLHFGDNVSVLGVTDISWGVLTMLALINAAYVSYQYIIRTWHYAHLSTRSEKGSDIKQNG